MQIVQIWALNRDVIISQDDIDYCKNNNIKIDPAVSEHQRIETGCGKVYHFQTSAGFVKLTTFDEKGECMLQLRYADQVNLLTQIYTEPVTHSY